MNIIKTMNGQRLRLVGSRKQRLEVSVIGEDMEVMGCVHSFGVVKVYGTVLGDVLADAQLLVAKGGRVEGDVCAREMVLNGEVYGSVVAEKRVEVQGSAVIHGDITTPRLMIHEGAAVDGDVCMTHSKSGCSAMSRETTRRSLPGALKRGLRGM